MTLEIAAVHVRIPLSRTFATAAGSWTVRESWLIRLRDGQGRQGCGEAALDPGAGPAALTALGDRIRRLVERLAAGPPIEASPGWAADLDRVRPMERARLGDEVRCLHRARLGDEVRLLDPALLDDPGALDAPGRAARAALEAALVDGGWIPLGGSQPRPASIALNATVDALASDPAAEAARSAVAAGFGTIKLKASAAEPVGTLAGRVAAVRRAVGPDIGLRLDANGRWGAAEARAHLSALAGMGLEYVEQPVAELEALAVLRAGSPVPIAADELVDSPVAAGRILDAAAADVLVVKPARVGGPVQALRIATMAAERGVPVVVSTLLETGLGLATALRVAAVLPAAGEPRRHLAHGLATADRLSTDLLAAALEIRDGAMVVPAAPGAWPRPDDAGIRRATIDALGASW